MMLDRLRQETREEHMKIEAMLDLMSPALDLNRYLKILRSFHAAMAPLEAALEERCPVPHRSLWQGRQKARRLEADLACFGQAANPNPPSDVCLPPLSSASLWMGAIYVVEGSTLGGQVISRHLEKHFGWAEGLGYSYFSGYGEKTAERWRQVKRALEGDDLDGNLIVKGAHHTFHYIYSCLRVGL
jgi:heme oxygenase